MERGPRARRRGDAGSHPRRRLDGDARERHDGLEAKYLADLRSGARKFGGPVTVSDFVVRVYGDTAVAAGSSQSTVTLNGQPQGGALHFTRVYVKRNGAWKMIVTQATQRRESRSRYCDFLVRGDERLPLLADDVDQIAHREVDVDEVKPPARVDLHRWPSRRRRCRRCADRRGCRAPSPRDTTPCHSTTHCAVSRPGTLTNGVSIGFGRRHPRPRFGGDDPTMLRPRGGEVRVQLAAAAAERGGIHARRLHVLALHASEARVGRRRNRRPERRIRDRAADLRSPSDRAGCAGTRRRRPCPSAPRGSCRAAAPRSASTAPACRRSRCASAASARRSPASGRSARRRGRCCRAGDSEFHASSTSL